jgi:hypothetical protein
MVAYMPHILSELDVTMAEKQHELQPSPQQLAIERSSDELDKYEQVSKTKSAVTQNGSWSVYSYYISAAGWALFIISQTAMMAECFCSSFSC